MRMMRSILAAVACVALTTSCTSAGRAPDEGARIDSDPIMIEVPLENAPADLESIGLEVGSSLTTNFDLCAFNPEIRLETRERVESIRLGRYGEYEIDLCVVSTYACRGGRLTLVDQEAALRPC